MSLTEQHSAVTRNRSVVALTVSCWLLDVLTVEIYTSGVADCPAPDTSHLFSVLPFPARYPNLWDMTFPHRCWWRLRPVDWRRTFRWNVMPSSRAVGAEDAGKLTSRQGEKSQMTWIFTNTAMTISPPPTVPKFWRENYQSTLRKIPPKKRISHLHRVRSQKSRKCGSVALSALSMPSECTDRLAGCFLCCVVHVYAGHFRYKEMIPQQAEGKKK